jgi:beta-aspartyl-peptidase (threonine type)
MKSSLLCFLVLSPAVVASAAERPYGLVLHGGAGVIERASMTPEREAEYRAKLAEALQAGYAILDRGGPALKAVTATINLMEDSPLFNAGKGAVFNADGICELDASIMDGRTQAAGAIAGVQHIKNPINLARDVMLKSPHVMLAGEGAEKFARSLGYEMVPNEYFQTDWRREQLKKAQAKEKEGHERTAAAPVDYFTRTLRWGTVGCVALDKAGNLAAGTSTGGMTNKKFGRIGDAPIIGAGTYANNATCAVSATGWGEFFIRVGVARDIAAQMEYKGTALQPAAAATLAKVARLGGDGGVIALDAHGNIAMEFNSPGMYRAARLSNQPAFIAIYGDEARR